MRPHLLFLLLLLSDVTDSQSLISVSEVSVQRGQSITIPFLYNHTYKYHKKYCQRGSTPNEQWSAEVHNGKSKSSQTMSMSDDIINSIFTLTVKMNVGKKDPKVYHCTVEKGGPNNEKEVSLSDTADPPELYVQNQILFGYEGEPVVVDCHHRISGVEKKWCRLGGSCYKNGEVYDRGVSMETADEGGVFRVTLTNLRMENTGWYWCSVGKFQMPVHITVSKKTIVHTTTIMAETTQRTMASLHTSADGQKPTEIPKQVLYSLLGVVLLTILAVMGIIVIMHRSKKGHETNRESNPETPEPEITYTSFSFKKGTKGKETTKHHVNREDVIYSSVSCVENPSQAVDDVTYSSVSHQSRSMKKSLKYPVADDVTYSAVAQRHVKT